MRVVKDSNKEPGETMKAIGSTLAALAILILAFGSSLAVGEVKASLDRDRISLGDTLRLTLTATDGEELDIANLKPLSTDFEILQRSSSSNTSITNGRLSQTRQLIIDLTPNREGDLQIPALQVGQRTTPAIPIVVGPAAVAHSDGATVLFEAEVDQDTVYVQGQIILTLRVQQSIGLERRNISELKLNNAFVKPLEQRSFQRTIEGRQWLVDEVRYAVFPEQSGTLDISAQLFSGRVTEPRRGFFDRGRGGQLVRRSTQPIAINVLAKPASFKADTWLPVRNLTLEETWSTPPDELQVGESATRTIKIMGEGAQGAQLPPVLFTPIDGLKYYPDQPQISEQEVPSGLLGIRQDSAAVVPTRAGNFVIPEIRIPWWNVETKQMQYAVIRERKIIVTPGDAADNPIPINPQPRKIDVNPNTPISTTADPWQQNRLLWPILAAISTLGWLLTGAYLWRLRRARPSKEIVETNNISEKTAFKQILATSMTGNAMELRAAVIHWAASLYPDPPPVSLEQVAALFKDEELGLELKLLDSKLYGQGQDNWSGDRLTNCIRRLRSAFRKRSSQSEGQLRLYPDRN
jgi:hypothetical protein